MRRAESNSEHFIVKITCRIEKVEYNKKLSKKDEVSKLENKKEILCRRNKQRLTSEMKRQFGKLWEETKNILL